MNHPETTRKTRPAGTDPIIKIPNPPIMKPIENIEPTDRLQVKWLFENSGFFYPFEVQVVLDLFDETVQKGSSQSGYYWLKILEDNRITGVAVYGPNPCTLHSWDLYWMAVDVERKNAGRGSALLNSTEEKTREMGGKILWIETSGRKLYEPTVAFYHRKGYSLMATLPDYYGPGDPKLVFGKTL